MCLRFFNAQERAQYDPARPQRPRAALLVLAAALLLAAPALARADQLPSETWLGMYIGKLKIGYTVIHQTKTGFQGKTVLKTESTAHTEMVLLGSKMSQTINSTIYSDLDSRPLHEEFEMSSGGKTTKVLADFHEHQIECQLFANGAQTSKSIPIPSGVQLAGDTYTPVGGSSFTVGQTFKRKSFNPLTLALEDNVITVDRETTLRMDGRDVKAVVVTTKTPLADLTTYMSIPGDEVLKIEAPMGITMLREPKDVAMATGRGESPVQQQDLAVLTSVRANADLPSSKPVTQLQVRLSGIPDQSFVFSDGRQFVQSVTGDHGGTVTYLIHAADVQQSESDSLPVTGEKWEPYLASTTYIQSGSPDMRNQAQAIVGSEKNIYLAASLIRKWINQRMKPRSDMGILRPADDVLTDRSGVCRDYAVLFAALARAAGIPTRLAGGLIYSRGGFYYHVWDEVWMGKQWTPFDSTLDTDFVDATHIKLAEGTATDMYKMGKIVGQLKADILTCK